MKPLFPDKSIRGDKLTQLKMVNMSKLNEMKTAEVFNSFFSNIIKILKF